jgi:hypothetical protein
MFLVPISFSCLIFLKLQYFKWAFYLFIYLVFILAKGASYTTVMHSKRNNISFILGKEITQHFICLSFTFLILRATTRSQILKDKPLKIRKSQVVLPKGGLHIFFTLEGQAPKEKAQMEKSTSSLKAPPHASLY